MPIPVYQCAELSQSRRPKNRSRRSFVPSLITITCTAGYMTTGVGTVSPRNAVTRIVTQSSYCKAICREDYVTGQGLDGGFGWSRQANLEFSRGV